jgi:hypothetical protein
VSTLDTILTFFQGKGLTRAQAAGIAGNWQIESGLNPRAYNPGEGAIGLAQWERGRREALDSFAARTGGSETDLNTQLNFAWFELTGSEHGALERLQQTGDAGAAASVFDQFYERSSGLARGKRVAAAQSIAAGGAGSSGVGAGGADAGGAPATGGADAAGSSSTGSTGSSGWQAGVFAIGLKVLAAGAAAGLVIVGATRTVSS